MSTLEKSGQRQTKIQIMNNVQNPQGCGRHPDTTPVAGNGVNEYSLRGLKVYQAKNYIKRKIISKEKRTREIRFFKSEHEYGCIGIKGDCPFCKESWALVKMLVP